ncbi:hypothetical protein BDV23DRAFT_147270 [Aspergillus alliaceus]|uniref:BZIP domain-containing protein n=1 Tax=Petromyces alliaceus TaxID=209559 RepID=A0A5N7CJZ5_PETAA|nr:hypothetical protein BDV23DRAFT_147270 [Aspergillus alliaceus]
MASATEPSKRDFDQPFSVRILKKGPDDWSGLTDAKERRRRQNRINQRAYRQRKRTEKLGLTIKREDADSNSTTAPSSFSSQSPPTTTTLIHARKCPSVEQTEHLLDLFSKTAYQSYVLGSPTSDHLLTLSKVNVFRAFASIMSTLGLYQDKGWMHDDAISPFTTLRPGYVLPTSLPPTLRPTPTQQSIPHHPWLDFFPHPHMRDNLIRAGETFDDEQLCVDIMGFWDMSTESCGLLVWGDPQDLNSWEVSEAFIRKWPWVLWGCRDLLVSTNRWRALRGEKLIFRYL